MLEGREAEANEEEVVTGCNCSNITEVHHMNRSWKINEFNQKNNKQMVISISEVKVEESVITRPTGE